MLKAKSLKPLFFPSDRQIYTTIGFEGCFFCVFGLELVDKVFERGLRSPNALLHKVSRSEPFQIFFPDKGWNKNFAKRI